MTACKGKPVVVCERVCVKEDDCEGVADAVPEGVRDSEGVDDVVSDALPDADGVSDKEGLCVELGVPVGDLVDAAEREPDGLGVPEPLGESVSDSVAVELGVRDWLGDELVVSEGVVVSDGVADPLGVPLGEGLCVCVSEGLPVAVPDSVVVVLGV